MKDAARVPPLIQIKFLCGCRRMFAGGRVGLSSPSEFDPGFVEDTMKILSRTALPALALLASIAVAQAQPQSDEHQGHHPDGRSEQAQPTPDTNPAPPRSAGMPMQ